MRFKVLEERFKSSRNGISCIPERTVTNGHAKRQSLGGLENLSRSASSRYSSRNLLRNGSISSKVYDSSKLVDSNKLPQNGSDDVDEHVTSNGISGLYEENGNVKEKDKSNPEDFVSGMLYDMLQKEVLTLRKACHQKDQNLKDKDGAIEVCRQLFMIFVGVMHRLDLDHFSSIYVGTPDLLKGSEHNLMGSTSSSMVSESRSIGLRTRHSKAICTCLASSRYYGTICARIVGGGRGVFFLEEELCPDKSGQITALRHYPLITR